MKIIDEQANHLLQEVIDLQSEYFILARRADHYLRKSLSVPIDSPEYLKYDVLYHIAVDKRTATYQKIESIKAELLK